MNHIVPFFAAWFFIIFALIDIALVKTGDTLYLVGLSQFWIGVGFIVKAIEGKE
jgi:hypothetical protein